MIWFTSDTHFNHKFCMFKRHYKSLEDMDNDIIKRWNSCVQPDDEIYHLGDFAFSASPTYLKNIISQLNGKKHLILGNHDKEGVLQHLNMFESIDIYKRLLLADHRIILFHYPIADYDCMYHNSIHLYGHVHNNPSLMDKLDNKIYNAFNVCWDANNFKPVSLDEIIAKSNPEKINVKELFYK